LELLNLITIITRFTQTILSQKFDVRLASAVPLEDLKQIFVKESFQNTLKGSLK
jgi:hypothetical protein